MCGICGTLNYSKDHRIDAGVLKRMISMIRHRGPDEFGIYVDDSIGLGHARLSIIDLTSGSQPIHNEDETIWVVFNGEIFNYLELREELISKGHNFYTKSDTEVIIHLYEEYGRGCTDYMNGQFAFAIWDSKSRELMLARDRLGIRPLFYTVCDGSLIFGSEIKSIMAHPIVNPRIDVRALDQIFSFWAPLSPRTIFENIWEVPPGCSLIAKNGNISVNQYWRLSFPENGRMMEQPKEYYTWKLRDLLISATRLRLRADVPVGAYLSGGLDSSVITTIINNYTDTPLKTFSIRFADRSYDEGQYQQELVRHLDTDHRETVCRRSDIAEVFPEMIWHTESPILRTAPVPLYLLSRFVRQNNIKVVLTGEGADEFLGGYNIYKEAKIRRFWSRQPDSQWRPLLLQKLYPYLAADPARTRFYWQAFFRKGLSMTDERHYSHMLRWGNTSRIKTLFSDEIKSQLGDYDGIGEFSERLCQSFDNWDQLSQAQYIEVYTFLTGYLLCSQGDRPAMANSVEGRFPFLDHNVVEFCSEVPPKYKLKGLIEKYILKKSMSGILPESILEREKQPYRAPDSVCFFEKGAPDYVEGLLSPEQIKASGYFDADAVDRLVRKCKRRKEGSPVSAVDDMAIVGILSLQLLYYHFFSKFQDRVSGNLGNVKIFDRLPLEPL